MGKVNKNFDVFEKLNIHEWHRAGYTGKGVRIMELEGANPLNPQFDNMLINDFDDGLEKGDLNNSHGSKVFDVIHQVCPDSKLFVGSSSTSDIISKTVPYIDKNDIHLVGASLGGFDREKVNIKIRELKEKGVAFFTSVGNTGDRGAGEFAKSEEWINTGAVHLKKGKPYRPSYSSIDEVLDFTCYSNIYIESDKKDGYWFKQQGTSFSNPLLMAMAGLINQKALEEIGRVLCQSEIEGIFKDNVMDLGKVGRDEYYGHGLVILPNPKDLKLSNYVMGNKKEKTSKTNMKEQSKVGGTDMNFKNKYNIRYDLLREGSKRRSGKSASKIGFIVAHDTGNKNSTAANNVAFYKRRNKDDYASAHTFIDDKEIIEIIPATKGRTEKAWHVRYNTPTDNLAYDNEANDSAIGVELCYGDNINFQKAYDRYIWYITYLTILYDLNPYIDITGHFLLDSTRKTDPVNALRFGGKTWKEFLLDVISLYEQYKDTSIELKDEEKIEVKVSNNYKPNLKVGMSSEYVTLLENALIQLGYFTEKQYLDQYYGTYTEKIVREFQTAEGIEIDGRAGPQTWATIQKAIDRKKKGSSVDFLKEKMNGGEVVIMEKMLDFVGYNLGSYKDDYFGWVTTKALKKFQEDNNLDVDGIYGINTKKALEEAYIKKKEQPVVASAYRKIRMYDSDIHIYKTQPQDKVRVEIGNPGVLEKLSNIFNPAKAKINAGFFGGGKEHLGMLIREGLYYYPPTSNFIDFIYYKNGKTQIKNLDGYDGALLSSFQNEAHWAIGTSWSLIQEGEVNLENADKISHSGWRNPRTFFGQNKDGTFTLCVIDGRKIATKGVTAKQEAEIAKHLGLWNAVNLDGGGSSVMIVAGKIMNNPSDKDERLIGSAIVVK